MARKAVVSNFATGNIVHGLLIAVAVYIPYGMRDVPPGGGSVLGLIYGTIGFSFMAFVTLLSLRKKFPIWRIGRTKTWMRGHLWLGAVALPLIWLHGGFRHGGWSMPFFDAEAMGRIFEMFGRGRELASDCRSLARFRLRGIPPMPAGMPRIAIVDHFGLRKTDQCDQAAQEAVCFAQAAQLLHGAAGGTRAAELRQTREAMRAATALLPEADGRMILTIGRQAFPFPVPIVREGDSWKVGVNDEATQKVVEYKPPGS